MVWEPFAIALFLGLLCSATLHFIFVWPHHEPQDDDPGPAPAASPAADAEPPGHG